MSRQPEWLFEAPLTAESALYTNLYSNPEFEWEQELSEVFPLNEEEWETVGNLKFPRRVARRQPAPLQSPRKPGAPVGIRPPVPSGRPLAKPPIPRAKPRVLTYTTKDVIDKRISIPAQHSLVRLSKNPATSTSAVGMLEAVKAGRLAGIYCVNWEKAAKRALRLGSNWWTVIRRGEDAVLMLDPDNLSSGQPLIALRRELDPDCGLLKGEKRFPPSPSRIDRALLKTWTVYLRWRRGEILAPCSSCIVDGKKISPNSHKLSESLTNRVHTQYSPAMLIFPPGCFWGKTKEPKKLFVFKVGNDSERTVQKWIIDLAQCSSLNRKVLADECTVSVADILKAAEVMAYKMRDDLKQYFAILTDTRNLRDSIEIVLKKENQDEANPDPEVKQEIDRIKSEINDQVQINNWSKARSRILDLSGQSITLATKGEHFEQPLSLARYVPWAAGPFSSGYYINPFSWYDSSGQETMSSSAERARIAFSPIAIILHELDHDKGCILSNNPFGPCNVGSSRENPTIVDIDTALGAHPYIAKRFAYVGGWNYACNPEFPEQVFNGTRVYLDQPLAPGEVPDGPHSKRYSEPALASTRPTNPSQVWVELPSDCTLRSGKKCLGPYKKP